MGRLPIAKRACSISASHVTAMLAVTVQPSTSSAAASVHARSTLAPMWHRAAQPSARRARRHDGPQQRRDVRRDAP